MLLRVLDIIERDASVTQRTIARELGIALGLANTYLRRCVRKGLIKVSQAPARRYAYYITPQGFAEKSWLTTRYLSNSFSFFRQARTQCRELLEKVIKARQRRLALIGHGDLADIFRLLARDYPVEVAGVIEGSDDCDRLTASATALGPIDAVVVTTIERAPEVWTAARSAFGASRVYAPPLLRVSNHPAATTEADL